MKGLKGRQKMAEDVLATEAVPADAISKENAIREGGVIRPAFSIR